MYNYMDNLNKLNIFNFYYEFLKLILINYNKLSKFKNNTD